MMREEFYQSQYGDPVNNYEIKAGCSGGFGGGGGAESAESAEQYDDGNQDVVGSMDVAGAPDESFLWSEERSSIVEDCNIRRRQPSCCIESLHVAVDLANGTQNEILLWSIAIDEDREDDAASHRRHYCRRPENATGRFSFRDRVISVSRRDVSREILLWLRSTALDRLCDLNAVKTSAER